MKSVSLELFRRGKGTILVVFHKVGNLGHPTLDRNIFKVDFCSQITHEVLCLKLKVVLLYQ